MRRSDERWIAGAYDAALEARARGGLPLAVEHVRTEIHLARPRHGPVRDVDLLEHRALAADGRHHLAPRDDRPRVDVDDPPVGEPQAEPMIVENTEGDDLSGPRSEERRVGK